MAALPFSEGIYCNSPCMNVKYLYRMVSKWSLNYDIVAIVLQIFWHNIGLFILKNHKNTPKYKIGNAMQYTLVISCFWVFSVQIGSLG